MRNLMIPRVVLAFASASLLVLPACQEAGPMAPLAPEVAAWPIAATSVPPGVEPCGDPITVDLLAGQTTVVGYVGISNDGTNLYVTYNTTGGWTVDATHLDVALSIGETPLNPAGNPTIGKFTYSADHVGATMQTYTIPLADLGAGPGVDVIVAAHAEVSNASLNRSETAWADGTPFTDGGNWAMWAGYTVQSCEARGPIVLTPYEFCTDFLPFDIVTFADANLEAVVRQAIGVPAGDLLCGQVSSLISITGGANRGIADLAGLQNLTGLVTFSAGHNAFSDLSPMNGLTNLVFVDVQNNPVSDITALAGLTQLQTLSISDTQVSDLTPLAGLASLHSLNMIRAPVTDIGVLTGRTSLQQLVIDGTPIIDFSPLSSLTNLALLSAGFTAFSDASLLAGLTSLTHLSLIRTQVSDISSLSGLVNLDRIELGGLTALSDISVMANMTKLRTIGLNVTIVSDLSPLTGLTDIRALSLANNAFLNDLQPLIDNTGIGTNDFIDVRSTGVSCTDVATLEARGVIVNSDCI